MVLPGRFLSGEASVSQSGVSRVERRFDEHETWCGGLNVLSELAVRLSAIVAGALASLLLLAAPALATYHLNMVNEVMLASSSGDSSVQFVEFIDHGGSEEQFTPAIAPYKLVIYDAAGNKLGEQTLDPNGLRAAAAANREYLVSTPGVDSAFHVTGDERLTVTLPLAAGQACFEGNTSPPTAVSCLTWGTITKPVPINMFGTGSANGPMPPNGESDQREAGNSIVAACPTPKASNTSTPCAGTRPAFVGIGFATRTVTVDRHGRTRVRLRCPTGTDGSCQGQLALGPAKGSKRFGSARYKISPGESATVPLRLASAALRVLRRHGKLHAVATAVAHDAAGSATTTTSRLKLTLARTSRARA